MAQSYISLLTKMALFKAFTSALVDDLKKCQKKEQSNNKAPPRKNKRTNYRRNKR